MTIATLQEALGRPGAGTHVTNSNLDEEGFVVETPAELALEAGEDLEVYSLARMLASEGYGGASRNVARAKVAMAQCAVNRARARAQSKGRAYTITELLTAPGGLYSEQNPAGPTVKWAATSRDPTRGDVAIAREVVAGTLAEDLARGAWSFLDPAVYVGGKQGTNTLSPFATQMAGWHNEDKMARVPVPGVDPFFLMVFRSEADPAKRAASLAECVHIYDEGRAGRHAVEAPDVAMLGDIASKGGALVAAFILFGIGVAMGVVS